MSKRRVELRTAFYWYCDNCDAINYALPKKSELTDDAAEIAYRKFHNLEDYCDLPDDWRDFELVEIPPTVQCNVCDEKFETIDEQIV